MKVAAKHWVNHNGTWYQPGETYDDGTKEIAEAETVASQEEQKTEQPRKPRRKAVKEE